MVFVALVMPLALLGVLFAMDLVEQWVVREAEPPLVQADVRLLIPEQRQSTVTFDPEIMVSREAAGQSL